MGLARAELDVTDADAVRAAVAEHGPDVVLNCAAYTNVDGAEEEAEEALRVNGEAAGIVAAEAPAVLYVSSDYVFDGRKGTPYLESDPTGPVSSYGRSKLAGEIATAAANPRHFVVRTSWLFGAGGKNFVDTMLRVGGERDEARVVADQVGCPTYTGHLARGAREDRRRRGLRRAPRRGGGLLLLVRAGRAPPSSAPGVDCELSPITTAEYPLPAPAARLLGARHRARARCCRRGRTGSTPTWPSGRCAHEAAGDRSGRVHRIHLRPPGAGEHDVVVLDKLTYAGRRENLPEGVPLVVGAIEDPTAVREAMEGVDAVVNFAAESHVDRSIDDQSAFARTHLIGTGTLLDAARELGVARYLQVSTDEVYGSIASGSFTEESPLDPSSPYSATKAAGDLLVSAHAHTYGIEAVICRGSNNYGPRQYPEKLIPLMILNAMHGDGLPVYGDGRQVRNWLFVEDFCRGIHTVLERGRPGSGLQRRRARRVREPRGGAADPRAGRPRRVADRARAGPARPRPPLLALLARS